MFREEINSGKGEGNKQTGKSCISYYKLCFSEFLFIAFNFGVINKNLYAIYCSDFRMI